MRKLHVEECSQALLPHPGAWGVLEDLSLDSRAQVSSRAGLSELLSPCAVASNSRLALYPTIIWNWSDQGPG